MIYVCMYVCMHACMHVCMHAWMYVCMYECMHAWNYALHYVRKCPKKWKVAEIENLPKLKGGGWNWNNFKKCLGVPPLKFQEVGRGYICVKSDTQLLFIIHSAAVCSKVERDNRKREKRESVCLAKPTATHDNLPGEPSQTTPTHQD